MKITSTRANTLKVRLALALTPNLTLTLTYPSLVTVTMPWL